MLPQIHDNASITIAIALAAGMLAQSVAQHLKIPGIVVLLLVGVGLGPDAADLVQPASLGSGLKALVGVAVAVILFEGGMSLEWRRLRTEARSIRQLITFGALVSLVAGGVATAMVMGWSWRRAVLFGTLAIVTGPTVVTPLVRRMHLKRSVATVLEAEGVLVDAIGAITAAVALEIVLSPTTATFALAAPTILGRLAFGVAMGLLFGVFIVALLRYPRVVPEGLENVLTLSLAVLAFELSGAFVHESGIAAVIVAGMVVGNSSLRVRTQLAEFKEQLTVLLIGLLFVLLAADVRLSEVRALGWGGALVAILMIVVVRPLSVVIGTLGTDLTWRERTFVAWIGPRGIVAAAVASHFGYELAQAGVRGGTELRSLMFVVIAATVAWSALTGPLAARALGVRRRVGVGWVIVGANALGRRLASLLDPTRTESLLVDNQAAAVDAARVDGLPVLNANALESEILDSAELDTRIGAIAITPNEDTNYLFAQKARRAHRKLRYAVTLSTWQTGVTPDMVAEIGGEAMFGGEVDVTAWSERLATGSATVEWWSPDGRALFPPGTRDRPRAYVPLVHRRRGKLEPITDRTAFDSSSELAVLIDLERDQEAREALMNAGWTKKPAAWEGNRTSA